VERIVTDIYRGLRVPVQLCRVEHLTKAYGDDILFDDLSFELHRGERVAVLGPNGCGKTTLVQVLLGNLTADKGEVIWPKNADAIDFGQVVADLDPDDTVSHAVNVVGLAYLAQRRHVNRFLSMLRFSDMDLRQPIGTLSGGERARVALAQCLLSGAPVLVMDEPTNHLDLTAIQVMENALIHFPGAVLVASHDRFFVDKVAPRVLVFEGGDGRVREVSGNWTVYQASRLQTAD
jgi:ATP-binding cassette subfamily F protein 3